FAIETTRRRFDWIMCCFASMSPRSIFFASSTSCAAVSSACLPASRRKSWSASVVVSTGWTAVGGGAGSFSFSSGSSARSSIPRRSSSGGSSSSTSSCWRSWPLVSAASSSPASSSLTRMDSISTVNCSPSLVRSGSPGLCPAPSHNPNTRGPAKSSARVASCCPGERIRVVHENGRYVKLAQMLRRAAVAAAACALFLCAGTAGAEVVPGSQGAQDSLLAVAPDGSPRVAYVDASGAVVLAGRAADGTWALSGIPLAAGAYEIVGLAQAPAGADVLVETATGSRLVLAEQHGASWRVRTVASAPATGELGFGGLALDPSGRPLVAYASRLASQKSYLRLVHEAAAGKLVGEAVTKLGFPKTSDLPTVAPVVLANGTTRIVEAFDGATIEWARTKSHTDWTGQFLFA